MKKIVLIAAFLLFINIPAKADDLGGNNPGIMNKQNMTQIKDFENEKQNIEPAFKEPEKKKEDDEDSDTIKKDTIKGNLTYNPQFKLTKIVFKGNTIYPDKKLLPLANKLMGKDIYLEDVMDLTIAISRYYQKNGYLTSYAYLEPQEIKDGTVVVNIKESRVGQKEVTGNRWERDWYLKNLALGGNGLSNGKIFNSRCLQGAIDTIKKEPYLKSSVEITKDKNEDTVIKLNIADRFPISLDVAWDDFGRNYSGRQRATTVLGIDNLTGFGDKIYAGTVLSSGAVGALAGYQIPVSPYGTKLSFDYSYSRMDLGGPYKPYDIRGNSTDFIVRLVQPLKHTATTEVNASVAVDALNSKTDMRALGTNLSDYRLRVLRTGIYGIHDDKNGRYIASIGADLGTTAFGASENITNGAQSSFYKIVSNLTRVQRLPKKLLGIARINGQYSPQTLYPSEQMYLGGAYSLRGYQPSEILGDYGVAGTFEVRTPIPKLEKILPKKINSWADKIKLAAFYDWGYVKENGDLYNYPDNFLQSVGFGTYVNITEAISAQVGVGIPLGKRYYNEDNARLYFSVNSEVDRIFMKPKEKL